LISDIRQIPWSALHERGYVSVKALDFQRCAFLLVAYALLEALPLLDMTENQSILFLAVSPQGK
jgi:hypothetical protein